MKLRIDNPMSITERLKRLIRRYGKGKDIVDPEEFHQSLFILNESSLQEDKTGDSYAALNFILLQLMKE